MRKTKKATKTILNGLSFWEYIENAEANVIAKALKRTKGNQKEAAGLLQLRPQTLHEMMKRLEISPEEFFQ